MANRKDSRLESSSPIKFSVLSATSHKGGTKTGQAGSTVEASPDSELGKRQRLCIITVTKLRSSLIHLMSKDTGEYL